MVYDKDYLIFVQELLDRIDKLKQEAIDINIDTTKIDRLKSKLMSLDNQLNDIEEKANAAFEVMTGRKYTHDEINEITKIAKEYDNVGKTISQIQDKLKKGNLNKENKSEYKEKLKDLKAVKKSLSEGLGKYGFIDDKHISAAADYRDEIENVGDAANNLRHEINGVSKEHEKILEQTKEWGKNVNDINKGYQQFTGALKKSFSIIKDSTEFWRKQDEQITKMVATFGLTNDELKKYRDASYKAGAELAFQFGKTQEDLIKLQQGYAEATGKNIILTKDNYEAQFQLQQLMGEEDSMAFTSGIEQFGVGINDARDRLYDIYKLNKANGVSWSKSSKELNKNLKIAQKYNFKGGLDNMMKMTIWANKMKINLQTIASIADRISNPEGAIETAAKLQVLGGAFSSMANPLQMLYESLDDVGGLAERVEKMFDGLGRFDRKLGEVRIAGPDRMRIKAAAEAMGMSYEEAMDIVNNKAKREAVEQDVQFNPNITRDNRDFLATLSQWNNTKKQFEVRTYDEKNREYVNRNINELSNEEIEKLRQEPDDDIRKLVENTFSINANIDKLVNGAKMALAATQEDKYGDTLRNQLKSGNDMLSQMESIGATLDAFYTAAMIYYGAKSIGGITKMGKGAFNLGKMAKSGRFPNTFGGKVANNMAGEGSLLRKGGRMGVGKFARGSGIAGAALATGYGLYNTFTNARDAEQQRAVDIANGDLIEGSAEDKQLLRDIKKMKRVGYSGAAGSGVGAGLGAWGGAALGATIGSVIPGPGTALGGLIGAGLGSLGGGWLGDKAGSFVGDAFPVDDGIANKRTVIKANKDDTALFAKDNGPFDKLFGNIIPKIDNIYDELSDFKALNGKNGKVYGNVAKNQPGGFKMSNRAITGVDTETNIKNNERFGKMFGSITKVNENKNDIIIPKPIGEEFHKIKETTIKDNSSLSNIKLPDINVNPIELKLAGTLKLDMGSAGQVDIMKDLKGNPTFMRELSKMLVEQMSSSLNGGKPKLEQNRFARFQS